MHDEVPPSNMAMSIAQNDGHAVYKELQCYVGFRFQRARCRCPWQVSNLDDEDDDDAIE